MVACCSFSAQSVHACIFKVVWLQALEYLEELNIRWTQHQVCKVSQTTLEEHSYYSLLILEPDMPLLRGVVEMQMTCVIKSRVLK